jgi:nitrate reductase assembly molybdenum cofactor insertion protein NarJ/Fe-S-cluster-containing hydrogenase component 2
LFADALEIASSEDDAALQRIIINLAAIPPESLEKRRSRYHAIFSAARPHLWLYESLARDGRLAGPTTFAIWQAYESAGLKVADSELPDHASVELAFLAYLASQEAEAGDEARQWRKARRLFIKHHAGQWLPALGQALTRTQDEVYSPIGNLLTTIIHRALRLPKKQSSLLQARPIVSQSETCHLCGFCVQVCPTRALTIRETETTTTLLLNNAACTSCQRCIQTCPSGTLHLENTLVDHPYTTLRQSPRAHCPACGQPTVSQAEIEAVSALIGTPVWLEYCLSCRTLLLERTP